jgi:hypothetical protein
VLERCSHYHVHRISEPSRLRCPVRLLCACKQRGFSCQPWFYLILPGGSSRLLISLALLKQGVPHPSRTLRRVGVGMSYRQHRHPPLQRTQGRGTHSCAIGGETKTEGWATRLATSASAGASRRVGIKSCDQRCMIMFSNRERILDCKRWVGPRLTLSAIRSPLRRWLLGSTGWYPPPQFPLKYSGIRT